MVCESARHASSMENELYRCWYHDSISSRYRRFVSVYADSQFTIVQNCLPNLPMFPIFTARVNHDSEGYGIAAQKRSSFLWMFIDFDIKFYSIHPGTVLTLNRPPVPAITHSILDWFAYLMAIFDILRFQLGTRIIYIVEWKTLWKNWNIIFSDIYCFSYASTFEAVSLRE